MPLALAWMIGLPVVIPPRVASVEHSAMWGASPASAEQLATDPLLRSIIANPVRYDHAIFPWNEPEWRRAEVPAANAIGTARSIARFYDRVDELLSPATLELAGRPLSTGADT